MFEKLINPVWVNFDRDAKGFITPDQLGDLAKYALEKAGHGDKYNEALIKEKCNKLMPPLPG